MHLSVVVGYILSQDSLNQSSKAAAQRSPDVLENVHSLCFCCDVSGWLVNYEAGYLCSYVFESLAERCLKTTAKPDS